MAKERARAHLPDRILIVENDPSVSDLIGRQALGPQGYQVQVAADAASALTHIQHWAPDLLVADLHLPGLSGKDLMVALSAQGCTAPVIILARRGMEADLIQTFRLGAADVLLLPAREAEVVNAVERVLGQVRARRERESLETRLQQANQELHARVRELTTIFALGKAMTSITDQGVLLEKVLDAALHVARADLGWFLLREDAGKPFLVAAQRGVAQAFGARLRCPWDDGISSLVAMSGEPLSIQGQPLERFKISAMGKAALIVPVKSQQDVIGVLVVMRRKPGPFGVGEQHLLEGLSDYASISLVNARLFRAVEGRARSLQELAKAAQISELVKNETLRQVKKETAVPLGKILSGVTALARDPLAPWTPEQKQQMRTARENAIRVQEILESVDVERMPQPAAPRTQANLGALVQDALQRLQATAARLDITIVLQMPSIPVLVVGDPPQLLQMVDGLVTNAIQYSLPDGKVTVALEKSAAGQACLVITNTCLPQNRKSLQQALEKTQGGKGPQAVKNSRAQTAPRPFAGLGVSLPVIREIVRFHGGEMMFGSSAEPVVAVHVHLPLARQVAP
jgi:DNA-binding response OmpR family regulator/signal transduction histidine kinase